MRLKKLNKNKKNIISFKSKYGWVSATEYNGKLIELNFKNKKINNKNILLKKLKKNINNYFLNKTRKINVQYELIGTKIQKRVWDEIKKTKFGETKSYGEIAKKLNISPRFVGKICGQNRLLLIIPCHRIKKSNGELGGFSGDGGIKLKRKLLDFESN